MPSRRGAFLSFEGIDGAGKSTQVTRLAEHLRELGHKVITTREPGGSEGAEAIRALLVEGEPGRWSAQTEILLFTAARRDHLEKVILPALERGEIVVTDRFADSTRIYQGATRGDLRAMVDTLHDEMIGRDPDLTLILDCDPEAALQRGLARKSGEDRFEDMGLAFQQKLRAGFHARAAEAPERCRLIPGDRAPEAVAEEVAHAVLEHLDG